MNGIKKGCHQRESRNSDSSSKEIIFYLLVLFNETVNTYNYNSKTIMKFSQMKDIVY